MKKIDLRSDTVTRPTPAMRQAMMEAEVGDDVYQEDPTVNTLERRAAELTGKETALFVTSGSMGNLIALYVLAGRGTEVLTYRRSHIIEHELASAAAIAGVLPIGIDASRGILSAEAIETHLYPRDYAAAPVGMIEVENTCSGACYPLETLAEIGQLAAARSIPVHMDGARLMNAAVAAGCSPETICRPVDSVSFCLSKGLGAPVGSMLCGPAWMIAKARSVRKMLGGGMRQAGILAAAGLYALDHHIARLADDHRRARSIAAALAETAWAKIEPELTQTNIILFDTPFHPAEEIVSALAEAGILCFSVGPRTIRMVTHLDISEEDTESAAAAVAGLRPETRVRT